MTFGAAVAELAPVHIIVAMTAYAGLGQADEAGAGVAGMAVGLLVSADQRPKRMRPRGRLAPARRDMAIGAFLAQFALVRIVFGMAIETVDLAGLEFLLGLVAATARHADMGARQRKIGLGMVEEFGSEKDNARIAASVLGMASPALRTCNLRVAAMEAFARRHVARGTLVAGETKRILGFARKSLMTVCAHRFQLGMGRT